jgi:cytochrome P450
MTNFKTWFQGLPPDGRERFASAAGTTVQYVMAHLVHARKVPRKKLLAGLCAAAEEMNAPFARNELINFFYLGTLPAAAPAPPEPATEAAGG